MRDDGVRLECPVCLGVKLAKLEPSPDAPLVLDYCTRCGGIWFDEGEVPRLRECQPRALAAKVELGSGVHRMRCHGCGASLARNDPRCGQCGRRNILECPVCRHPLEALERHGLRLDACRTCRGVWFDNVELGAIWNDQVTALARRAPGTPAPATYGANYFLLDAVLWGPDLVLDGVALGAHAAGTGLGALADGVASAGGLGEIAGAAVEGTGHLAGSVFEAIADIIGGLFS
jgi:Zn-finger nucleic acid-binding protein